MKTNKKLFLYLLVISIVLLAIPAVTIANTNWGPQFNLNGRMGNGNINGFVGQGSITYPFKQQDDSLFYLDIRGMTNGNKVTEYNLGFGYRKLYEEKNNLIGGYVFKDWRNEFDYTWQQWTIGAEYLTTLFDLRVNGYFPTEEKVLLSSISTDQIVVSGNNVLYEESDLNTYYKTMSGYDIEIGKRFSERFPVELGVYLRAYNFSGENMKNLSGTGLRINTNYEISEKTDMKIGLDWQNDNVRGSNVEATIGFSFPLGDSKANEENKKDKLKKRMVEAPQRDINVIVNKTEPTKVVKETSAAVDPETSQKIGNAWFVTKNGDGNGTKENPTNINNLTNSSKNDLIIILGDDGEINTDNFSETTSSLVLKSGQKIVSPSGSVYLKNEQGDRIAQYSPVGQQATLTNDIANNILEIADNTSVSGLIFKNGKNAIYGSEVSGELIISNNIIQESAENGILIESEETNSVIIENNIVNSAGDSGIALRAINIKREDLPMDEHGNLQPILNQTEGNGKLNITITQNEVQDVVNNGINLFMYSDDESELTFSDNSVDKVKEGMNIWSYAAKDNMIDVISNNVIEAEQNGIYVYANQLLGESGSLVTPETITLRNNINYDNNITITDNKIGKIMGGHGIGLDSVSTGQNMIQMDENIVDYLGSYSDVDVKMRAVGPSSENSALLVNAESLYNNSIITAAKNVIKYSGGKGITANNIAQGESSINITRNELNIIKGRGIYSNISADSNNLKINYNIIKNSNTGIDTYIWGTRLNLTSISENNIEDSNTGIEVDYSNNDNNDISITNNKLAFNSSSIRIDSNYTNVETIISITNNNIRHSQRDSIEIDLRSEAEYNIDINNNNIDKSNEQSIRLYLSDLNTSSEVNIYNNNIYEVGRSAIYVYADQTNNAYINIHDNQMKNNDYKGVNINLRGSQLYTNIFANEIEATNEGIYIEATADWDGNKSIINSNIYQNNFYGSTENENNVGIKLRAIEKEISIYDPDLGMTLPPMIITSSINAGIDNNIFDENINYGIVKEGEIVNITGNQAQ